MPLPRASPIPQVSTGAPNKYLAMTSFTDNAFPYALWFGSLSHKTYVAAPIT